MTTIRASFLITLGCAVILVNSAAIDNSVYTDEPRISSGDELISAIMDKCFYGNTMLCLKEKVLSYLDTVVGLKEAKDSARFYKEKNFDKLIFDRLGRILSMHEIKVQLPQTLFQNSVVTYRNDRGIDIDLPKEEGRGDILKKKLLLPVLLLLKLKLKALMPILVAVIGLKAMKALILSKIAITLVLGFLIYNLIQKLGGLKMSMMPMAPPTMEPMTAYGPPAPASSPASSYEPSSWEPSSGGPYSRVWEPSGASSAQNLAYSAYYPSSSSGSNTSGSSSSSSTSSSSSSYPYSS